MNRTLLVVNFFSVVLFSGVTLSAASKTQYLVTKIEANLSAEDALQHAVDRFSKFVPDVGGAPQHFEYGDPFSQVCVVKLWYEAEQFDDPPVLPHGKRCLYRPCMKCAVWYEDRSGDAHMNYSKDFLLEEVI